MKKNPPKNFERVVNYSAIMGFGFRHEIDKIPSIRKKRAAN
jgi:hypothetical protein